METLFGIDYPTWWFLVVGGLFSGYAILDGFDLGAGALHLFFKKEESRRIALNAVGPVWDGNEVWLVIGGGALFAGFPDLYATLFSAMYIPFMLFLAFLIFRAVSIEFRSKEPMLWWRKSWDIAYSISSMALGFLLGVVLGNVLSGIAFDQNHVYQGTFFSFLNPYSLLTGLTTLALFTMHGGMYLVMKTEGRLYAKTAVLLKRAINLFFIAFAGLTVYTLLAFSHLTKIFIDHPLLGIIPLAAMTSIVFIPFLARKQYYRNAFICSSASIALLLLVVAIQLYPVLLTSTLSPDYNITIYTAASSVKSLKIMLLFAAIGTPLVLLYTVFVYRTFRGKVKMDETSY